MSGVSGLSILLPCFNRSCVAQVDCLRGLADWLVREGIPVEIVVVEDGSTQQEFLAANAVACAHDMCRHVVLSQNVGRARVRNILMQEACHEWMLLMDCDLMPASPSFLYNYMCAVTANPKCRVVYGGVLNIRPPFCCLRYNYENATAARHAVEQRQRHPYVSLSAANMMLHRSVAEEIRFDERFRTYGYEDVMFGRQLRLHDVPILHIDNPVEIREFESNERYVQKTEEAMHTLCRFRFELHDDVLMLRKIDTLRFVPLRMVAWFYHIFGSLIRRNLVGSRPWWRLFNVYKLSYYAALIY